MVEKREHYITAAYANRAQAQIAFCQLIEESRTEYLNRPVTNRMPPPERQVVLVVAADDYERIQRSSLQKVYGFIFDSGVFLDDLSFKPNYRRALRALLARVVRENQQIKHYDINVALFMPHGSEEDQNNVYGEIDDLCRRATQETNVRIHCDLIQTQEELRVFLNNQLRAIVCGDTNFQLETSPN
jgi:hypothetical protein